MKRIAFFLFFCVVNTAIAAPLKEVWTVTAGLLNPESSHYDAESQAIYVSNVAGEAMNKDGVGWISKISLDGKVLAEKWVEGLNAPKGIRVHKGRLWVSDIDTIVGIDVKTAKVMEKVQISAAKFLNDVEVGEDGTVYVSDMLDPKIYTLNGNQVDAFVAGEDLQSPNGLIIREGKLFVGGWGVGMKPDFSVKKKGGLYAVDLKSRNITKVSGVLGNLDGLEFYKDDTWLVTDWISGDVFRYDAKAKKKTILVRKLKGAADIGYVPEKQLLLVPEMNVSKLHAYELK